MCLDYPVTSYTVVVEDSGGVEVARITDNRTQISIGNLTADLSYTITTSFLGISLETAWHPLQWLLVSMSTPSLLN